MGLFLASRSTVSNIIIIFGLHSSCCNLFENISCFYVWFTFTFVVQLSNNIMDSTAVEINNILKNGIKKINTFNKISVLEIECTINISQSLVFSSFLSSLCVNKGRTESTIKEKTLNTLTDWYDVNGGSISISHITGKSLHNKTNYFTLNWAKEIN